MRRPIRSLGLTGLALILAACGGGGSGGGVDSIPPPSPSPTTTPTPTPSPPPLPSGPLGLTGGPFTTEAASLDGITGTWPTHQTEDLQTGNDLVEISYSAADNSYTMTLPGYGEGQLVPVGGNGSWLETASGWQRLTSVNFEFVTGDGTQPIWVTLNYPGDPENGLSYTSSGRWFTIDDSSPTRAGVFAYGVPTVASTMPISGTASYAATVSGYTRTYNEVWGSAELQFDFGASTLAGSMTVQTHNGWDAYPLGTFTFFDTVYSTGSTTFSENLSVPGSTETGNFAGQFTGPGAAELLANFRSPAFNPMTQSWDEIAGVWTGKRN